MALGDFGGRLQPSNLKLLLLFLQLVVRLALAVVLIHKAGGTYAIRPCPWNTDLQTSHAPAVRKPRLLPHRMIGAPTIDELVMRVCVVQPVAGCRYPKP